MAFSKTFKARLLSKDKETHLNLLYGFQVMLLTFKYFIGMVYIIGFELILKLCQVFVPLLTAKSLP